MRCGYSMGGRHGKCLLTHRVSVLLRQPSFRCCKGETEKKWTHAQNFSLLVNVYPTVGVMRRLEQMWPRRQRRRRRLLLVLLLPLGGPFSYRTENRDTKQQLVLQHFSKNFYEILNYFFVKIKKARCKYYALMLLVRILYLALSMLIHQ